MSGNADPVPEKPAVDTVQDEDVKARVKAKAAQTREAVGERSGDAARTAQEKVAQAKGKVSDLATKARETGVPSIEADATTARRGGAAAGGVAAFIAAIWVWRRRSRRNSNPWLAAADDAKSQIKSVRKQAKSGVKRARKQTKKHAEAQVKNAKSKAKTAKKKAKSWK